VRAETGGLVQDIKQIERKQQCNFSGLPGINSVFSAS